MHLILRTCAAVSKKPRPGWYSKAACLENLLRVFGTEHEYYVIADGPLSAPQAKLFETYRGQGFAIQGSQINAHSDAGSFTAVIDYACQLEGDIYLVEDDYVHRPGAPEALRGGLRRFDYTTGYDHPDKYMANSPNPEVSDGGEPTKVVLEGGVHFKHTNSTTHTFAVRAETLREDAELWRRYSTGAWAKDYAAFCELRSRGRTVGSSIPAYATHCENNYLAPLIDWEAVIRQ
ncbi:MAG: hypothetical protein QGD94_06930 [Planctomycetia bacterium]|nr:hypothetical protein [Planctomycetia bacterium]